MKTKKEFRYFNIFQYQKEQEYLRRRHQEGWRFVKVSGLGVYHFEACTPEDVVYQLDYNQEGLAHKEEYVQMFRDCGWEHVLDYVGYSYFRKPLSEMTQEEEIFNDAASKLEMAKRIFRGKILPLLVIFIVIVIPMLIRLQEGVTGPERFLYGFFVGTFIVYLSLFIQYVMQYVKLRKNVRE